MKIVHNLPNTVADRKYKKYGKSMISYSTFEIEWHWNTFLGFWFTLLYGIFVFAQYFVSPPHCVRRIRLTKKCEHEKIGPQNSD